MKKILFSFLSVRHCFLFIQEFLLSVTVSYYDAQLNSFYKHSYSDHLVHGAVSVLRDVHPAGAGGDPGGGG